MTERAFGCEPTRSASASRAQGLTRSSRNCQSKPTHDPPAGLDLGVRVEHLDRRPRSAGVSCDFVSSTPTKGDPDPTGLANTASPTADSGTPSSERSPSRQALRHRVRAVLFDGATATPTEYEAGTVLGGRFRIVGLVGRGGMGEVYRARDLTLDEDVAVKFLPQELAHDERFMTRFVREVRVARQVTHANVCRVHDIGEVEGRTYLSMEFIDGEDLASLLRRIGRLPLEKASELAQQLCRGLAALHERDVLHRDLKPHNLMVDGRGKLKITDFGLAAAASELGAHELRDGTPAYMAPEQAEGREVTLRSDLYSLGLILYEILTGKRVRDGSNRPEAEGPDSESRLSTSVPGVPQEVDEVIRACLQPEPSDRPSSALAVAAALPGGDPVAAALAMGQTPSIDALLHSGSRGAIPALWGHSLALLAVATLFVLGATFGLTTILGRSDTRSPEVLRHQARELLDTVAWSRGHFVEHSELRYDRDLIDAQRRDLDGRPVVLLDYRRQGPPLVPRRLVSMTDPPYDVPGASRVTLDGQGRLRSLFTVLPPGMSAADTPPEFTPLLAAAQLDVELLESAEPTRAPPAFVDHRVAWRGYSEALQTQVEVEAASRSGHIVAFDVIPAWDERFGAPQTEPQVSKPQLEAVVLVPIALLLVLGLGWLARRVVRSGEADTRGATRVAIALAGTGISIALLDPDLLVGNSNLMPQTLALVLGTVLVTYWAYLVVEPFSRRYAPGAMTSWVRLVRGRFTDPTVARDVLLGVGMSVVATGLERLGSTIDGLRAYAPATLVSVDSVAGLLNGISGSMAGAPILFLLFVGLVRLVRSRRVATALLIGGIAVLFVSVAMSQNAGPVSLVAMMLSGTLWGLSIARVGLLGLVTFQLTRNLLSILAISFDAAAWYTSTGILGLVAILALIGYGWRYGVVRPAPAASPLR